MISKIIIAASDDDIRRIIQKDFSLKVGENNVQVCGNHNELNSLCKYAQDTAVIFDKYFLGYVVSYELIRLKTMNPKLLIYFTEIGRMSETFATRVCQYKVDGYICDVEDSAHLQNQIMQIRSGKTLVPECIRKALKGMDLLLDGRCVTELSEREMQVAMLFGFGFSQKEISVLTGLARPTVCQHLSRAKRKIGYKSVRDICLLNESYWNSIGGNSIAC